MSEAGAGGITGAPIPGQQGHVRGVDVYRVVAGSGREAVHVKC